MIVPDSWGALMLSLYFSTEENWGNVNSPYKIDILRGILRSIRLLGLCMLMRYTPTLITRLQPSVASSSSTSLVLLENRRVDCCYVG